MTTAAIFHDAAMEYYDLGKIAKAKAKPELYQSYLEKAYILSKEAALKAQADPNDVFWKYVYTRSAAHLAIEKGQLNEAKRLVHIGLAGTPPIAEKAQLEAALNTINKGLNVQNEDKTFSISGVLFSLDMETRVIKVREVGKEEYYTFNVPEKYIKDIARLYLGKTVSIAATTTDLVQKIQLAA